MSARTPFFNIKSEIISNTGIAPHHFKMAILAPQIAAKAKPGQFINIRISDGYEPLLRRPFSIHKVTSHKSQVTSHKKEKMDCLEILYKVVGKGTEILSKKKPREILDIIGPLGNGFTHYSSLTTHHLLIGGGVGIAPLLFLAENLVHSPQSTVHSTPFVLIGARTKDEILCESEFKRLGCDIKISTDDGSKGSKGKATELLRSQLSAIRYPLNAIYACGPKPMLKELSRISKEHNIPAQVSLEAHMACGIGVCLGCVVKVRSQKSEVRSQTKIKHGFEYRRVCNEGPVFDIRDILWE